MASYSFVTRWDVPAPPERVWDEFERMLRPGAASWWPGLTLEDAPSVVSVGSTLVLAVRSPLGYRLRVRLTVTSLHHGRSIAAVSAGDLRGTGGVEIQAAGGAASVVVFRWDVATERAWMNATARILRPAFERAHASVMRAGERGLRDRLSRA